MYTHDSSNPKNIWRLISRTLTSGFVHYNTTQKWLFIFGRKRGKTKQLCIRESPTIPLSGNRRQNSNNPPYRRRIYIKPHILVLLFFENRIILDILHEHHTPEWHNERKRVKKKDSKYNHEAFPGMSLLASCKHQLIDATHVISAKLHSQTTHAANALLSKIDEIERKIWNAVKTLILKRLKARTRA